jgi:hypothetical protein
VHSIARMRRRCGSAWAWRTVRNARSKVSLGRGDGARSCAGSARGRLRAVRAPLRPVLAARAAPSPARGVPVPDGRRGASSTVRHNAAREHLSTGVRPTSPCTPPRPITARSPVYRAGTGRPTPGLDTPVPLWQRFRRPWFLGVWRLGSAGSMTRASPPAAASGRGRLATSSSVFLGPCPPLSLSPVCDSLPVAHRFKVPGWKNRRTSTARAFCAGSRSNVRGKEPQHLQPSPKERT